MRVRAQRSLAQYASVCGVLHTHGRYAVRTGIHDHRIVASHGGHFLLISSELVACPSRLRNGKPELIWFSRGQVIAPHHVADVAQAATISRYHAVLQAHDLDRYAVAMLIFYMGKPRISLLSGPKVSKRNAARGAFWWIFFVRHGWCVYGAVACVREGVRAARLLAVCTQEWQSVFNSG